MSYNSRAVETGAVTFPEFTGERRYMVPFFKNTGLPSHLTRWQNTVDAMLDGVDSDGPIFMTLDQKIIAGGRSHRTGGIHIDGYWNGPTDLTEFGGEITPSTLKVSGWGWCSKSFNGHMKTPFNVLSTTNDATSPWAGAEFADPEAIILASSFESSRGYTGQWHGDIGKKGDCADIDVSQMDSFNLAANKTYIGNVSFLHESLPVEQDTSRTLVRLIVRGWEPVWH